MSRSTFKSSELKFLGSIFLRIFKLLHIVDVEIHAKKGESEEYVQVNNMTLINFIILVFGPLHEKSLVKLLLLTQVGCSDFYFRFYNYLENGKRIA